MNLDINKIEDFGYDTFFKNSRTELGLNDLPVGRIITQHKGSYKVVSDDGTYLAKITGKKTFNSLSKEDYPAVGDWVVIDKINQDQAIIHEILTRKTVLKRKKGRKEEIQLIATNIDVAFIVESVGRDYNLNRFERYCALVRDAGITPILILNKIESLSKEEKKEKMDEIKERINDVTIIFTSTLTDEGIQELKDCIEKRKTYCLLGSSGVGKSSLINKLLEKDSILVGSIGEYSGRGKHTTTQRELYFLDNGGMVIDNPGIREVGITEINTGVDNQFDEIIISAKKCKFSDCSHVHEPGCNILKDLESGDLNQEEYNSYLTLKSQSDHYGATKLGERKRNKRLGKIIKTIKKDIKKSHHRDYL